MSRGPVIMPAARWGARLGDASVIDYMNGILHDPFGKFHMGITAENIAERYGITRQMQDELAFESQQRAARAVADGRRSEEHTSELQSLMRNPYAVFCLKKHNKKHN